MNSPPPGSLRPVENTTLADSVRLSAIFLLLFLVLYGLAVSWVWPLSLSCYCRYVFSHFARLARPMMHTETSILTYLATLLTTK